MTILDDARAGMDPQVRPQDDLFGHVNGRWLETEEIPEDRSSWGPFVTLGDEAEGQVRAIIEELVADSAATGDAGKIADLYLAFLDEERIEALGAEPIADLLAAAAGVTDLGALAEFLGAFERVGGSSLFGSYINTDDRNSDRYLANFVQGGLGLPDESYYRDEKFAPVREAYLAFGARMFELIGHPDPQSAAATVLAVETKLAAGHWERAETRDVIRCYNLMSGAQLQALCPSFDFARYVTAMGGDPEKVLAEVIVRQPSYYEHLSTVLTEVPIADWRTLLALKIARGAAPYLASDFVEANFDFYARTLAGTPQLRARWKRGVALVEGALGEALGKEYVARHFPPASKAMMDELVANLLEAYRQSIAALDWMSEETKERAYAKLATFRPKIGYPERFRDYSDLMITPGDLMASVRAAAAFETDRQLAKIGAPVDRDEWFMLPQTVNAYYNPGTNEICFPAGILQKPFFAPDADPAENYGGIGAVIGHEIGHGFDDQGAQYDELGNMHDWWTAADKAAFGVKTQALVEQYDAFEPRNLPGEHVSGNLTVGENIGDLGGLTIGHKAYVLSQGGSISTEQSRRLFLNWAYVWRTKRRAELERQYLTIDPHSPPEFRANIVRNLDEFHDAFETTETDGLWLEPGQRVRIW